MNRNIFIPFFALATALASIPLAVKADLLGESRDVIGKPGPVAALIERNESLRMLSDVNQELAWLIAKRLLELTEEETEFGLEGGGDAIANPDLDSRIPSSPEAVLDLIELMEKASNAR